MKIERRIPPVWLMGLSNATVGLNAGIIFFVMPQMLAAEHISEATIATVTAVAMASNFWTVLFGPMLDVRFSRRWYATVFAGAAAALVIVSIMNSHRLPVLQPALALAVAAAILSSTALGGWLSNVCPHAEKNKLSAWINIAFISGTGITSALGGELVRHLPDWLAACLLGSIVLLPTVIFLVIPAPGPDRRLAAESFRQFNSEVLALLRQREMLIVLLLFLSPCGSFALTNLLGGLGNDFHASSRVVSLAGGAGIFFAGILGCLLFPMIAKQMPLRLLYLANGSAGALFTLCLIVLPRAPWTFALALVGLFMFQAMAYAIQIGITFEVIGENNPLAATTFTFLVAATFVPVAYMIIVDGKGYSTGGIAGGLAIDAALSITACILLGVFLARLPGNAFSTGVPQVELIND